jgi:carbon-monoxide dehydrogenase large subunit
MTTDTTDIATRFGSGQSVKRLEDEALLKGTGQYTDDIAPQGQLRLCFVRSPYPHARIVSVDTSAAKDMPGVVGVYTGAELAAAGVKPIPGSANFKRAGGAPGATPPRRVLAHERVRHVGEAVAMVVAETMQQARDAAEAVYVEYEELPHVVDLTAATTAGAPALCDEAPDNIAAEMRHGNEAAANDAFAAAAHVVKLSITNQRVAALTIEPRSVLAWIADDGRLTLRMSTQMPSGVRNSLCNDILGMPRDQMRVTVGDVGGGFRHEDRHLPRGRGRGLVCPHAAPPGQVDRRAQRGIPDHGPRPRPAHARPRWRWPPTARCWRCACARWPTWAPTPPAPAWPSSC